MRKMVWGLLSLAVLGVGCDSVHPHDAASTAVGTSAESVVAAVQGGTARGPLYYEERSTRGVWALKVHTPKGVRIFYVSPAEQRKPFAQASYTIGQPYQIRYTGDPSGESDGLAVDVKPAGERNQDIAAALDVVSRFYDDIYFFHLDGAYAEMSGAAHQKMTLQAFKDEWPGDSLTQQVDWNSHFAPRRLAVESQAANQVVFLADITRLFKVQTHSEIRRVTLVREGGQWRVDNIDRATPDDFLN
ncbi:MAG TPA: hypothetical protein VGO93_28525 [Candidatus Xenobia bacterium]|jgi:hypothetical protein